MNNVLASRQRQNQLPEVNQQIQPIPQPPVEHHPTEQLIEGGSTSNRGDISSGSDRTNSPESGSSHPTRDANLRSLDRNRSTRNQRAQRMHDLLRNHIPSQIHVDIRPTNILLGEMQQQIVPDLGLANSRPIQQPGYMAPEQLAGRPRPASDQFALAVMDHIRIQRQNQLPEVDQQLLERFRQEDANRQQHHERATAIIQEQNLDIEVPNPNVEGWPDFAVGIINEYEDQHGLGSSRLLGDILQGGIGQATDNERNSDEYKELMTWVLSRWRDHRIQRDHNNA